MNKVINIDWLQINCKGCLSLDARYEYKIESYSTRVFKQVITVMKNSEPFCVIACKPLSPIIPQDTHLIKFDNKLLYKMCFMDDVIQFVRLSGLSFKGVSRLDLCIDFNIFDCNLLPDTFINNFVKNKYHHYSKSRFKLEGSQTKENKYHYIRFGSNTSIISTYLYNKTKEMNEKTFKQHIYNTWITNDINVCKDVWRLEFSIKSSKIELINKYDGDCEKLTLKALSYDKYLNTVFFSLVHSYFRFAYNNKYIDKSKFVKLPLFKMEMPKHVYKVITTEKDTNRSDKVFIRRFEKYNNELRSIKSELAEDCELLKMHYISSRRLTEFYHKKIMNGF